MKISNTLDVISECWKQAEESLRAEIREDYPGANEEFITQMFHGQFSKTLKVASREEKIGRAFLRDLKSSFSDIHQSDLRNYSQGLMADVVLHRRTDETVTGGDMGVTIASPLVWNHRDSIKRKAYRCGLLCQAKLKGRKGKWNDFSDNQKIVLRDKLQYLGLLLYEYSDADRRELKSFQWQLCHEAESLMNVLDWLKKGIFPSVCHSEQIIKDLGSGTIGTHDEKILDEVIAPVGSSYLEIIIDWPDDKKPDLQVRMHFGRGRGNVTKSVYARGHR